MKNFPTAQDLLNARERIRGLAHVTPVMHCESIDRIAGAEVFFKCENLQKVGAFKFRGATNALLRMPAEQLQQGVATHSSGNHAQALALAARMQGVPAYIVMPNNAPEVKKKAVAGYGAEIIFCEPTLAARESTLDAVVARTAATFVHPYDNWHIIEGQSTAAQELIGQVPVLNMVLAPVGGGGLMSGTALAVHYFAPGVEAIGAEPMGADDAYRSLQAGRLIPSENPNTLADGLLTSLGERTFAVLSTHLQDILTVSEDGIREAMRLVWERMKLIIEPSSAVPLAAVLANPGRFAGKRIGIIVSGGNVDLGKLPF